MFIPPAPVALQGRGHTRESSSGAQSEEVGHDAPGLYPGERGPSTRDRGEHEDRGPEIQQPSEPAPRRTSSGDQDGGDFDDLAQSGRSRGKSWCSGFTPVRIDRYW